ncbi:MAG: ATP-binding protein [Magnetococcus sp. DMHC-6]
MTGDTSSESQEIQYNFRTLDDAHLLANQLAQLCPKPESAELGLLELMINAIEHGNLGISYKDKSVLISQDQWSEEVKARLEWPENINKKVFLRMLRNKYEIRFIIQDQGQGFAWQDYLNIDPNRVLHTHGRGIAWAKTTFDYLEYQGNGNEVIASIYIIKRIESI